MYHRQVTSSPRLVDAIMSSSEAAPWRAAPSVPWLAPPPPESTRLSTAGVTGSPASPAEYRLECSADSVPSETHDAGPDGSPLSNTDESCPDACATTNGAHSRPGYARSLHSETGKAANPSP